MRTRRKAYMREPVLGHARSEIKPEEEKREKAIPSKNSTEQDLAIIYQNVKSTPSYSAKVNDFLRSNPTSSLHRQVRKRFQRRKILCYFPYDIIMSDLIDYNHSKMPHANGGYRYIMVFIDCFSKVAWAEPMKRKDGLSSLKAFENVFRKMQDIPQSLITDRGLEYYDRRVQAFLSRFGVRHYNLRGPHKASIAERFIKTLKGRLEKYF